jgi:hypothetical protein
MDYPSNRPDRRVNNHSATEREIYDSLIGWRARTGVLGRA